MRTALTLLVLAAGCSNERKEPRATGSTGTGVPSGTATGGTGTGTGSPITTAPDCAGDPGAAAFHLGIPYPRVQDAIDAAQGGAVFVCPGTHAGNLRIDVPLELIGVEGSAATTLAGDGTDAVITALDALTLTGLTVTGGSGTYGGGIDGSGAPSLALHDCILEGNQADYGGGLLISGAAVISASAVRGNTAVQYGGGIAVEDGGSLDLSDTVVSGNAADLGGGLFAWPGASILGSGGDPRVEANSASSGGGAYLWTASLDGVGLSANEATGAGGGIYAYEGAALANLTLEGNTASFGAGLAAELGPLTADSVEILGNTASVQGGGLHLDDLELVAIDLLVQGNEGADLGGGAFVRDVVWTGGSIVGNQAVDGGGIYASSTGASVELHGLTLEDNDAVESGGGLNSQSPALTATGLLVLGNRSANRGGGVYCSNGGLFDLGTGEILGNEATSYGGGLYANGGAVGVVTDTRIEANLSERGAGIYVNGASALDLAYGTVLDNGDANTISGGGVRIQDGSLTASLIDFGGGPVENAPEDIYCVNGPAAYLGYGAGTNLVCTDISCNPVP